MFPITPMRIKHIKNQQDKKHQNHSLTYLLKYFKAHRPFTIYKINPTLLQQTQFVGLLSLLSIA